jgi:hypothetical protein
LPAASKQTKGSRRSTKRGGGNKRQEIPDREKSILFLQSGGVCAFRGCGQTLVEPGTETDDDAILGEMAHIVADSRQGPRGEADLDKNERSKHTNLILLCRMHHRIIDSQPRTYSVAVLRQMKADHEARIRKALVMPAPEPRPELKRETIHSTLLPITHIPEAVFSAPCAFGEGEDNEVKQRIKYPARKDDSAPYELAPFILREGRLFAFHDLAQSHNPFSSVIDQNQVRMIHAGDMWRDAEGKRRYVNLLNRSMYKYTARLGIRYDPDHYRYYFPVKEEGKELEVTYRSMNRDHVERKVAWEAKRKSTGESRNFWWHVAARLRFEQMANQEWCLTIRPERHLTRDSVTLLPPEQIGRRVTSFKARMYNDLYIKEVVFWRDYLSQGRPRFILSFGRQSAVVDVQLVTFDVQWAGIPGDDKPFKNQVYEEDLFTITERDEAITGEQIDWNEAEDAAEDEEGDSADRY